VSREGREYFFIGREGKYQIPRGAKVKLVKTFARRKCIIEYQGVQYISMVNLLRVNPIRQLKGEG
jgi:hypothetical protein